MNTSAIELPSTPLNESVLPELHSPRSSTSFSSFFVVRLWLNHRQQLSQLVSRLFENVTAQDELVPFVLLSLALVILVGTSAAIWCQCSMWNKAKRKRRQQLLDRQYDSTSWLEYRLDRDRLNEKDSVRIKDLSGKQLLTNLNRSLGPFSTAKSIHADSAKQWNWSSGKQQHAPPPPETPSPPINISHCELVKAFSKINDSKAEKLTKMNRKRKSPKENEQRMKQVNKQNRRKLKQLTKAKSKSMKLAQHKYPGSQLDGLDLLPFFATLGSSSAISSESSVQLAQNEALMRSMPCFPPNVSTLSLQKEYETQTLVINVTGSEVDEESLRGEEETEVSPTRVVVHKNRTPFEKLIASPSSQKLSVKVSPVKFANNGDNKSHSHSVNRRQQVPENKKQTKSNRSYRSGNNLKQLPPTKSTSTPLTLGTFAKNPLYSEICDISDSSEDLSGIQATTDQEPRQLMYSTFKPAA